MIISLFISFISKYLYNAKIQSISSFSTISENINNENNTIEESIYSFSNISENMNNENNTIEESIYSFSNTSKK